ncbi:unnamed protein product [Discula destructiva]
MSSNSASSEKDISSGISKLSVQTSNTKKIVAKPKPKKEEVADSWEEEDVSSDSDADTKTETGWHKAVPSGSHLQGTSAPPPTPVSATQYDQDDYDSGPATGSAHRTASDPPSSSSRPEKTDAVARRMIAGALGLKAPKLTDEQKAYQAAIKEKERKRREEQKAAEKAKEEEAAKARAAIWDD